MNVLTRRCGCGAVFSLIHLRDRSQQCTACQRKAAARVELAEHKRMNARAADARRAIEQKASQDFLRWAMERMAEHERHALEQRALRLCKDDFEQVGQCEMPSRQARLGRGLAALARIREAKPCP